MDIREIQRKRQMRKALHAFALQEHALFVDRSSSTRILTTRGELIWAMKWMKSQFPGCIPLYLMAENTLHNRFTWPGMEFVVDEWPCISACACRPARRNMNKEYVPMLNGYQVYIHASRTKEFTAVLNKAVGWADQVTFVGIDTKLAESARSDTRFSCLTPTEGFPIVETCFLFHLRSSPFRSRCLGRIAIPDNFRCGKLSETHVDLVTRKCSYADPVTKRAFFHYLLTHNFPAVALFDKKSESDDPVAYCMYLPDGAISEIYVNPAYAECGLYKAALAQMLMRLRFLGITRAWIAVTNRSTPAEMEAIRDLGRKYNTGGKEFNNHSKCCLTYKSRYMEDSPVDVAVKAHRAAVDGGPSTVITRENFDDHPDQHTSKKHCQVTATARKNQDAVSSNRTGNKKKFKANRRFINFSSTNVGDNWSHQLN